LDMFRTRGFLVLLVLERASISEKALKDPITPKASAIASVVM
jgi:hypothetical protein